MQKLFTSLLIALMLTACAGVDSVTAQTPKQQRKSAPQKQSRKSSKGKIPERRTTASDSARTSTGQPNADEIFARYQKAIGSPQVLRKLTSRVSRGTFEITAAGMSAPIQIYEKAPNKSLTVIELPGFGTILQGYNGSVAFQQQPQSGLRELSGKELAKAKRDSEFFDELNLKAAYTKLTLSGSEPIGGSDAFHIEATTLEGDTEHLYFDKKTALLVRKDEASATPQGVYPVQIYMEDYRVVDGIKLPFTVRVTNPSIGNVIIKVTEVKHNVEIEDSKFDKPSAP